MCTIVTTFVDDGASPVPESVTYQPLYPVDDLHDLEPDELKQWASAVQAAACSPEEAAGRTLTFDVIGHVGMWRLDGEAQGAFTVEVHPCI